MDDSVRQPTGVRRLTKLAALSGAVMIVVCTSATVGAFEPYAPANEQLRDTIRRVMENQTLSQPLALSSRVGEALRSIRATEGQTDATLAALLSTGLRRALMELERSRAIGELGYTEFDADAFRRAEAAFQETLNQFVGSRVPYVGERYQAALNTLADIQTLSRHARRDVPGLSSDDVQLMQEKRWNTLWKTVDEERENPPLKDPRLTPRRETASPR